MVGTAVVAFRERQHATDGNPGLESCSQPALSERGGRHAAREPAPRHVDPVTRRVLEHVAGDVRELHADAEIDREGAGDRIVDAEDVAAEQADGARDAVGVAYELVLVLDPHRAEILLQTPQQLVRDAHVEAPRAGEIEEALHGRVSAASRREITAHAREREAPLVDGLVVDEVVDAPAEGVEQGDPIRLLGTEEAGGAGEGPAMVSQDPVGMAGEGLVSGVVHVASRASARWGAGTMRSSTLAELRTPGRPAPGCVPAPTR